MEGKENVYPFEIKRVSLEQAGRNERNGFTEKVSEHSKYFIRTGPHGYLMPQALEPYLPKIYNMDIRSDDVFILTFPRSGTTWTQELVWLVANDFDYEIARTVRIDERFPNLNPVNLPKLASEAKFNIDSANSLKNTAYDLISRMSSPRFIKCHIPLSLLPPGILDKAKMVYVARDPRDVVVSYYHYHRFLTLRAFNGDFKTFWNLFRNDLVEYGPYFAHVKEAWLLRNHPNMLFIFYEELTKDMPSVIRRVANFLGKTVTENQIGALCEHLKFDNLRKNKSVNKEDLKEEGIIAKDMNFIRKGKVGDWRDYFDEEMRKAAEAWMEEGLRGIDFKFPY
ncbi:luciferin sulfotransferase-like [Amyelois transitella]|uniref:luciferin sulfotransferase-like n=1 Tax=Amyelois transitella TaxID=680683 RepID=UPI00298FA0AE|nr:luciferin sulfotransferase-like [Amyelois transitella]